MRHLRESLRGDHGAVATIFAIVFGAGVFVFLLALTVDVGRVYAERRVVQNAADSAAMAGGLKCALGDCASATVASLTPYANGSSPDNATSVTYLCVHRKGDPSCNPLTDHLLDCKTVPAGYERYVRLYTASLSAAGQNSLVPVLANALSGSPGAGTTVTACSQVAWGTAGSAMIAFPLALPPCGYAENVDQVFREIPSVASGETRWADCTVTDKDGATLLFRQAPKGFVQVTLPGITDCSTPFAVFSGQVLPINTANDTHVCGTVGTAVTNLLRFVNNPQYLPLVADGTSNTVAVKAFVKFRLKAFWFGNKGYPDVAPYNTSTWWAAQNPPCTTAAGKDCLYGRFEAAVLPEVPIDPNAPALGAQAVQPLP